MYIVYGYVMISYLSYSFIIFIMNHSTLKENLIRHIPDLLK